MEAPSAMDISGVRGLSMIAIHIMSSQKTRSRGGCATCKRRKRKCDQTRPACLACQRRKVECEGYQLQLQWDWGIASRGTFARATLPVIPQSQVVLPEAPLNESSPLSPDGLESPPPVENWDYQSDESKCLFSQFLHSGLHTLYSTSTHSWIKDMMVELSAESLAHLAACIAIQLLQDRSHFEKFHTCFHSALQVFRSELLQGAGATSRGTLGAGLLLCTISIDQGIPWTNHLQCMADLYGLLEDEWPANYFDDPYLYHLLEVMGVMDLPNLVLGRQTSSLGIWSRLRRAQRANNNHDMGGIEIVTGLPRTLLDILAQPDQPTVEQDLWRWEGEEGDLLQAPLWDAWRFSGILFARRTQLGPDRRDVIPCAPSTKHLLWRLIASLEAVRLGLQQKENEHLLVANVMPYPHMIASSESTLLQQSPEWMTALIRIQELCLRPTLSYNVRTARDIVDEAWKTQSGTYDIDQAARARGIEVALF